jgi:beta-phosphoglucomutase-like phosphatase (HAD superfamily)
MALRGLIFDFDGVIADSEVLANTVLAEFLSRLGFPTTLDDALERYMGKRPSDMDCCDRATYRTEGTQRVLR